MKRWLPSRTKYRDWLKSQPPEEVLNHAYEYTIREDIVMAMEELELTDTQAQALLESPSPLADVYRYFEKLETGYMDVIRDSIESRADDVCRAKEELRTTPVYPHSAAYASEHGEMAQYNLSYQANSACKEAIEQTISAHYAENRLDTEAAVKDVLEKFGTERVQFILANTIQRHFPQISAQILCPVLLHLLMDQLQFFCGHPKQNRNIPLALCHGYRSGSRFFGAADLWAGNSCLSFCRTELFCCS